MGDSDMIGKKYSYVVDFERSFTHVVDPQHPFMTEYYKHVRGDVRISNDGKSSHITYQYYIPFSEGSQLLNIRMLCV